MILLLAQLRCRGQFKGHSIRRRTPHWAQFINGRFSFNPCRPFRPRATDRQTDKERERERERERHSTRPRPRASAPRRRSVITLPLTRARPPSPWEKITIHSSHRSLARSLARASGAASVSQLIKDVFSSHVSANAVLRGHARHTNSTRPLSSPLLSLSLSS